MKNNRLLIEVLPELASRIKQVFIKHNRIDLPEQADSLKIIALCGCGENTCGSFYTVDPHIENEEFDTEGFIVEDALIAVEVYGGKVGYIENIPGEYGSKIHKIRTDCLG
jgi:hypothetical protein